MNYTWDSHCIHMDTVKVKDSEKVFLYEQPATRQWERTEVFAKYLSAVCHVLERYAECLKITPVCLCLLFITYFGKDLTKRK